MITCESQKYVIKYNTQKQTLRLRKYWNFLRFLTQPTVNRNLIKKIKWQLDFFFSQDELIISTVATY